MRRTAAPVLVAVLALAGCAAESEPSPESSAVVTPDTAAPATPPPTSSPTASPPTASATTAPDLGTPGPTPCPAIAGLRDGTWEGPITVELSSDGDAEFVASRGTGTLRVVVDGGEVADGSWTARWRSTGRAETEQASATITLVGTIGGTVSGTAADPTLTAAWRVRGTAEVTRPGRRTVPIDESGTVAARLAARVAARSGCERVRAVFRTSFTSKEAQATFTGDGVWQGRKVG